MFTLPMLGQVLVNSASLSAIYVLVAIGFTLLFGIMRVVNFAHDAFAMLGGYALYFIRGEYHVPYLLAGPLIGVVFMVAMPELLRGYVKLQTAFLGIE